MLSHIYILESLTYPVNKRGGISKMLEEYPDVLTIDDLKEILHYKSNTTIYKLLRSGQIKSIHSSKGNRYLIPKKNLIYFLMDSNNQ